MSRRALVDGAQHLRVRRRDEGDKVHGKWTSTSIDVTRSSALLMRSLIFSPELVVDLPIAASARFPISSFVCNRNSLNTLNISG